MAVLMFFDLVLKGNGLAHFDEIWQVGPAVPEFGSALQNIRPLNACFSFYRATACNATHGIAKALLSVCLSVCLSNAWTVTKRKKLCPHSYTMK